MHAEIGGDPCVDDGEYEDRHHELDSRDCKGVDTLEQGRRPFLYTRLIHHQTCKHQLFSSPTAIATETLYTHLQKKVPIAIVRLIELENCGKICFAAPELKKIVRQNPHLTNGLATRTQNIDHVQLREMSTIFRKENACHLLDQHV